VSLGQLGIGTDVACAARDHARAQRTLEHARVEALDARQLLDVCVDEVRKAAQMRGATRRTERGPRGERRLRRLHGEPGLTLAAARDLGEHGLVDRRPHLEPLVALDALAADEVVGRDGDAGDRRERAHPRSRRRRSRRLRSLVSSVEPTLM
jgi:hypothetical protein